MQGAEAANLTDEQKVILWMGCSECHWLASLEIHGAMATDWPKANTLKVYFQMII